MLHPGERHRPGQTLSLETARQLRHEGGIHRRIRSRHIGADQNQAFRILLRDQGHLVGPVVSRIPVDPAGSKARGDTPQILDQRQTEHDRDCPQFTQLQRADGLIGRDETAETIRIHSPVTVRDGFERDVIHARKTNRRTIQQRRQFAAVALWQVTPCHANLFLNQVKIVQQPFAGRGDATVRLDRRRHQTTGAGEDRFVFSQALQKPVRRPFQTDFVRYG